MTNLNSVLLALSLLWPLALVFLVSLQRTRAIGMSLFFSASLPALATGIAYDATGSMNLPWLMLDVTVGVDPLAQVFLLFTSGLWFVAALSIDNNGPVSTRIWFLVVLWANLLVILSQDIVTFYTGYALMSFATFGLIAMHRDNFSRKVAILYLVFAVLAELALLVALMHIAFNAGTTDLFLISERSPDSLVILLLLAGFGFKLGLPILHLPMPYVYRAIPVVIMVPVAGAMFHTGLYGWIRFLPVGGEAMAGWAGWFIVLGGMTYIFGLVTGLFQAVPQALLAYSSIAQAGLMMIGVGIGFYDPAQWPGVMSVLVFFALYHAVAKGALFYGLNVHGVWRIGLWVPILIMAGLPYTSGDIVKFALKGHLLSSDFPGSGFALGVLQMAAFSTTLLMVRFWYISKPNKGSQYKANIPVWLGMLGMMILVPWLWPPDIHIGYSSWVSALLIAAAMGVCVALEKMKVFDRLVGMSNKEDIFCLGILDKLSDNYHRYIDGHHHSGDADHSVPRSFLLVAGWEKYLSNWTNAVSLVLLLIIILYMTNYIFNT